MSTLREFSAILLFVVLIFVLPVHGGPQYFQQGGKLVGAGAVWTPNEGASVALSADGNTAIVGGPADNYYTGAVWVYTRNGDAWTQQGVKLVGTGSSGYARQGQNIALSADGNTAIIGGPDDNNGAGAIWVFVRDSSGVWSQQGNKLVGTGASGSAHQAGAVALSGDGNTALVGGYTDSNGMGAAWVFVRSSGVWFQQGNKLVGTGAVNGSSGSTQGVGVALSADGNTALITGSGDNDQFGAAWIFTRDTSGIWTQQGNKLVGTGATGNAWQGSGGTLSADGNTAVIGALGDNNFSGALWVFTRSGGVWTQQGSKLVASDEAGSAQMGWGVSISADGQTMIAGGVSDNNSSGAAWVFKKNGSAWEQFGGKLIGAGAIGSPVCYGWDIGISADGNTLIVGGIYDHNYIGAAWVYVYTTSPPPPPTLNPIIRSVEDVPHDQGGKVTLIWNASTLDVDVNSLPFYSIWRALSPDSLPPRADLCSARITKDFNGRSVRTMALNGVAYNWEWIANQPAHRFAAYSYTAPTLYDSMPSTNGMTYFLVSAQTYDPDVFYDSPVDSGYSVDNLAPMPPHNLAAKVIANSLTLHWNPSPDADLGKYAVYRSQDSITNAAAMEPYAFSKDTTFVDGAPLPDGFYLVRPIDIHDNYGLSSNEIQLTLTGMHESGEMIPASYALSQNYPNPFNPSTVIQYSLIAQQHVKISIYNMLGEQVMVVVDRVENPGYKTVAVNMSNLPSGIYLYRILAGTFTDLKKMLLIK
ncbi:MAG TPA: T9SS type A sorting domain-containing protein [Bacteroidota bacterium]|nr:T9SS type A sorting domain-containing protein [Bacteroidota bacterium]